MNARRTQHGMTLIELLVTMVIMGFVIATLSGALSQISQMLRISSEQTNGFLGRWTQSRALYDIVGNMVMDPTLDQPFKGTPGRIEMVSLSSPDAALGQPRRLVLTLEQQSNQPAPRTQVKLRDMDAESLSTEAQALTEFNGRIEFRYLDRQQREHSQWPVLNDQQTQTLPSAILLRETDGRQVLVRLAGYSGAVNTANQAAQLMMGSK